MNIEEKMWLYTEGQLSIEEHEKIAKLIATDEKYKSAYATYLAIENELKTSPLLHPTPHFVADTMCKIELLSNEKKSVKIIAQHGLSIAMVLIFAGLFMDSKSFSWIDSLSHFDVLINISSTSYLYIALATVGILWIVNESEVDLF